MRIRVRRPNLTLRILQDDSSDRMVVSRARSLVGGAQSSPLNLDAGTIARIADRAAGDVQSMIPVPAQERFPPAPDRW
jgi:hypothetical protein